MAYHQHLTATHLSNNNNKDHLTMTKLSTLEPPATALPVPMPPVEVLPW
jgi:hypothetical protein